MLKLYAAGLSMACLLGATSSTAQQADPPAPAPAWVNQPARTVDNGYVVYVSVAEDRDIGRATFKSQAAGILDIANECSFAPKGTRTEDHFATHAAGGDSNMHLVYTKTRLNLDDCEAAKTAISPDELRRLANPQLANEIKTYEELMQNGGTVPAVAAIDANATAQPPSPSIATPLLTPHAPPSAVPAAPPTLAPVAIRPADNQPIQNTDAYLLARQQVFYMKQQVILAPSGVFAPGSAQMLTYVQNVTRLAQRLQGYQYDNPGMRTWTTSWSRYRAGARVDAIGAERTVEHRALEAPREVRRAPPRRIRRHR